VEDLRGGRRAARRADLIKVDRVRSAAEAAGLEALGADLIGVSLTADPRFYDDRAVTVEQAAAIGGALQPATLVTAIELGKDPDRVLRTVAATRAGMVQPITGADLDELGRERPIVVGLDFTPDNVREIVAALPSVRGIALTLAEQGRRSDARFHRYADAVRVLSAFRPASGTQPTG
jgi:hypothetical protein